MTDNESPFKGIVESSTIALWSAYCDKKMELEDAQDLIEALRQERDELRKFLVDLGAGVPAASILRAEDRVI